MGWVARWLRSLLGGGKKEKDQRDNSNSSIERKEKKRWSFGKGSRDSGDRNAVGQIPATVQGSIPSAEAAWLTSYYIETEKEQNKHAIAVAAATAAAADAAVAAAQAAVAVVRLTSYGRGAMLGGHERWAAVKIQTAFRAYLAKKALRALKGLVKLQAHVRGYLVRKHAAATLRSMQALIRAQTTIQMQKARNRLSEEKKIQPDIRSCCKSIERFDDARSEHTASIHSRRLSASLENAINANAFEESPKIVEIDTCRPKSRSRRINTAVSEGGEDPHPQMASSPLVSQIPARLSIPNCHTLPDSDWGLTGHECRFSTAQSTPRFVNSNDLSAGVPLTPAKSVCTESFRRYSSNYPNYMANTQSFRAKLRSHSAPKQRPEPGSKKRLSLSEMVGSRASLSGIQMQRSCSQVQEAFNFKNAIMSRLDRSVDLVRESERDYLQRRW